MSQLGQNRKSSMGRLSWRPLSFLASATPKAKTSFNIAAGAATESSWCDYSAEVEMCRCEGEGEIKEASAMEYPHWLMIAGAVLVAFGFVGFAFSQNTNKGQSREHLTARSKTARS